MATTNEKDLLHMIRLVSVELNKLLDEFDEYAPDILNNYESQNVVKHTDSFDLNLITD